MIAVQASIDEQEDSIGAADDELDDLTIESLTRVATLLVWPDSVMGEASEPFRICTVGDDQLGDALDKATESRISDREVAVQRFASAPEMEFCHVMFVAKSEAFRQSQVLQALSSAPSLTASENPDFIIAGGMMKLDRDIDGVRYTVNRGAVLGAGLAFRREVDVARELSSVRSISRRAEKPATEPDSDGGIPTGVDEGPVPEISVELAPIPLEPSRPDRRPARSAPEYVIGAGDVLNLDVFGHEELSREVRVDTNGSVRLPLLGKLDLARIDPRSSRKQLLIDRAVREPDPERPTALPLSQRVSQSEHQHPRGGRKARQLSAAGSSDTSRCSRGGGRSHRR